MTYVNIMSATFYFLPFNVWLILFARNYDVFSSSSHPGPNAPLGRYGVELDVNVFAYKKPSQVTFAEPVNNPKRLLKLP